MGSEIFEHCSYCPKIDEEIYSRLPQFVLYEKHGKHTDCYCTACHTHYSQSDCDRFFVPHTNIKHNEKSVCIKCGAEITFKAKGLGRGSYHHKQNFAVLFKVSETIAIRCFKVYQYFTFDSLDPDFHMYEVTRYELSPGKAQQYFKVRYPTGKECWLPKKSRPTEPYFSSSFGYYADNSYKLINEDVIADSFLKYSEINTNEFDGCYITYLCRFAKYPNMEYLLKGGFIDLAKAYCFGRKGLRINWKSNDLKKMLKLNRDELKFLKGKSVDTYFSWIDFRKLTEKEKMSFNDMKEYFEKYYMVQETLKNVHRSTGLGFKKIMNYLNKQEKATIFEYRDYLVQCRQLEYDMADNSVLCPKNLNAAHDRLTKIIKIKADEAMKKQLVESNKLRKKLSFTDEARGLQILVPKSIQEIVDEGKQLSHCVGGYAERHAQGKLHILFLRKISEPDKPYYTMEVSVRGNIVQCRGYKNNWAGNPKPDLIYEFEKEYQSYLDKIFKKARKIA